MEVHPPATAARRSRICFSSIGQSIAGTRKRALGALPDQALIRLGVLLVLLAPCVDYVVTFSQFGGGDGRLMLSATPLLLVAQMLLLRSS